MIGFSMKNLISTVTFIHAKKLYLIPIGIILLLFLYSLNNREISIFPEIDTDKIVAFDDHEAGGDSKINSFQIDSSGVTITYTLKDGVQYPYTGLKLVLKKDSLYRDISAYDFFSIKLASKTQQDFNVYIHTIIPGYTQEANVLSYLYLLKTLKSQQQLNHFTVPIKSFTVPTWWYVLNKFPDDSLPKEEFKEVAEIIIENGYENQINIPYTFTLEKLSLQKDIIKRMFCTIWACLGWLAIYVFIYFFFKANRSNQNKKVVVTYEPVDLRNNSDESLNRIIAYIAKEYKDPGLTVNRIASEVGLLPAKITQFLRDQKNCSYKQYLNAIRLAEAKRLLKETDRNIVEISRKVGYNNVTHFNRIFKETEGVSPRQFRISNSRK